MSHLHLVDSSQAPVFTDWSEHATSAWGNEVLHLKHRLHNDPLFSDDALADLIDKTPKLHHDIVTMGEQGGKHLWREGDKGDVKGADVINAIRTGRFWISIRRIMEFDERYATLLKNIFAEVEERVPALGKTFKHNMGILISSPNAQVYYHADVPGQSLWQIRGSKRVYVYPNTEPFMTPQALEGIILGETEEEIEYKSWFDDHARVIDLEPGYMATWPLNAPHRVMNHDSMNVSMTTEHWTPPIRNSYAVHYANGVMRRRLGASPDFVADGPMLYTKLAMAAVFKKLQVQKKHEVKRMIDFMVDPHAPNGFRDIPAYEKAA